MVLLKDIIDEFMLTASDSASYIHGVSRTLVLRHAKRSLEEFAYAAVPKHKIASIELPDHKTVSWPIDAIDIIRIMVVSFDGKLTPVYQNNLNPIIYEFLKDADSNYVLDFAGNKIKTYIQPQPNQIDAISEHMRAYPYTSQYGQRYGLRGGEIGGGGQYRYNKETGQIHFFHLEAGTRIVLEYMSNPLMGDGISEATLSVPEYGREAVDARIYYEVIKRKANVPMNEKMRARQEYYHELKKAKKRINIKPNEIIQALRKGRAFLSW